MNTPVEAIENRFPIRVECYEFIPNTGGAGKFRGSLALRRDLRFLTGPISFARYSDRHKVPPRGLFGGHDGACGQISVNPGMTGAKVMKSKGLDNLASGDVARLELPGYGHPRERDPALIERDLRDGKITPEAAQTAYEVVLDASGLKIDRKATMALREGAEAREPMTADA